MNPVIKSIIFIAAYVIWDACYTIANVPYGSMLSLITEDKAEQAELSTWRSIGSAAGNVITMILPAIIALLNKENYAKLVGIPISLAKVFGYKAEAKAAEEAATATMAL